MAESQHLLNLRRALRAAEGDTIFKVKKSSPKKTYDHLVFEGVEKLHPAELGPTLRDLLKKAAKTLLLITPLNAHCQGSGEPYLFPEDNIDPDCIIKWPLQQWLHFIQNSVPTNPEFIVTGSWHYPGLRPASSQVPKSTGFIQFTRIS